MPGLNDAQWRLVFEARDRVAAIRGSDDRRAYRAGDDLLIERLADALELTDPLVRFLSSDRAVTSDAVADLKI